MPKFIVSGVIDFTFTIEGDTAEEAIEKVTEHTILENSTSVASDWSITEFEVADDEDGEVND